MPSFIHFPFGGSLRFGRILASFKRELLPCDAGEAAALLWLDAGDRKPTPPMDCSNSNMVAPPPPGDPPFPPIPRDRVGLRTAPEE